MSKPASKTMIGIFVVVAIAFVAVAVLLLGSGKFFKDNPKFVMYFDGSVKGLQVGAPVIFKGVKIGSVIAISMILNPKDYAVQIPVTVELEQSALQAVPGGRDTQEVFKKIHGTKGLLIKELIDRGLRAQLEMQSIVTGQLEIEFDFHPTKAARFVGADSRYPEIPTVPTTLQQLTERMEKIPIEEIFDKLRNAVDGIDKVVNSPEMKILVKSLAQGVGEGRDLLKNVNGQIEPLALKISDATEAIVKLTTETQSRIGPLTGSITKASDEATLTLKKIQSAVNSIEEMTGEDSVVAYRLTKTINELGSAAQSMRLLADTLYQQPDSIIFGKKNTGGK